MTRIRNRVAGAAVLVTAGACALFMEPPSVRIAGVRVSGIGLQGATAEVQIEVANPNGFSLTSRGIDYRLAFEDEEGGQGGWRTIAEGATEEQVTVAGKDTSLVSIMVPFRYEDIGRAFVRFSERGELQYRLTGSVRFDAPMRAVRIPFERTGDIGL